MKRETLDRFLGKEVTIKLFDNKYYKGFFYRDDVKPKRYLLKRPYNDSDISVCATHIKSIGSAGLYDKVKEQNEWQ